MKGIYQFIFIVILILTPLIWSCRSSTKADNNSGLEEIYLLNSQKMLEEYLMDWHNKIQPIDQRIFSQLSDTLKNIYLIYQIFYDPTDLSKYCTIGRCPEFGNDLYTNLAYFVVQNEIKYSLNEYENHITALNFQPELALDKNILYLTNEYIEELNSFLDIDKHEDDIQKRYDFLNTELRIWPGHWFGWHFLTHPEVNMIFINEDLDSAAVHFRIIFEGGEAKFRKIDERWEMIESKLTWIE